MSLQTSFLSILPRATLLQVALFICMGVSNIHLIAQDKENASNPIPWKLVTLVETPDDPEQNPIQHAKGNIPLEIGRVAAIGGTSRLEFSGPSGEILRVGHHSAFSPVLERAIEFRKGSFLLHLPEKVAAYTIQSPGVHIHLHAHGTFLGEIMSHGGIKLIPLDGDGQIRFAEAGTSEDLVCGQIYFFLPEGKRPVNVEVYLPLLLNSCPLIIAFEKSLPSESDMVRRARNQAKKIKTRTGSFVYDAVDQEKIRFLVPKAAPSTEKKSSKKFRLPKFQNPFKKKSEAPKE